MLHQPHPDLLEETSLIHGASSHEMSPGSQIALFDKCSFRLPSVFLPETTLDQFDSSKEPSRREYKESQTFPSGLTSGNPSGTFLFLPVPLRHTVISYLGKQDAWKLSNPDVLFLVLFWGEHQKIKKKLPAQLPGNLPGPSGDLPGCSVFVYKKSEEKASGLASGKPSGSFR